MGLPIRWFARLRTRRGCEVLAAPLRVPRFLPRDPHLCAKLHALPTALQRFFFLSMPTHKELLIQQQHLEKQIAQARGEEGSAALVRVKALVAEYGFTAQQVFPWTPEPIKRERPKADVKFRNPVTGAGWSGRGREPTWIAGKDRSAFAVRPQDS